jgi:hypothetical protein
MPSDLDAGFFAVSPMEKAELDKLTSAQTAALHFVVSQSQVGPHYCRYERVGVILWRGIVCILSSHVPSRHATPVRAISFHVGISLTCMQSASNAVMGDLQTRLISMGYEARDLSKCLSYLRDDAPLILHIGMAKMAPFMDSDTHYRNQFETGTSGGCLSRTSRVDWERRLFNGMYDSASDFDRVKYGVLNITNDPHGVRSCAQYGESYMILKNTRLRATFADMDSSSPSTRCGPRSCRVVLYDGGVFECSRSSVVCCRLPVRGAL